MVLDLNRILSSRRSVFLFDIIWEDVAQVAIDELLELNSESNLPINLIINSPGGVVNAAFGIIDIMNSIQSPVNTIVLGDAASAAAVIAACGENRLISENSRFMLHQVSALTCGKIDEMKSDLEQIEDTNNTMFDILGKCTGKSREDLQAKIGSDDVWFSAQESIGFGLADSVLNSDSIEELKLSESKSFSVDLKIEDDDKKLSRVPLFKVGSFHTDKYGNLNFSKDMLKGFIKNFDLNVLNRDVSIDITHENDDGEKEAVGWFKGLELVDDNLYALTEFNKKGQELIQEKSFKYASPEYVNIYTDEQKKPHSYVLKGATLTNRPAIKNEPIKLSEKKNERKVASMDKDQLIVALKKFGIDVTALQTVSVQLTTANTTITSLTSQVEALQADSTALKDLQATSLKESKERAFDEVVVALKERPERKELVLAQFDTAEALTAAYADMPALFNKEAIGDDGGDVSDTMALSETEQKMVDSKEFTKDEVIYARKFKQ